MTALPKPNATEHDRLLLPIILTTAFVIFGACRRAVWDVEAGAVDEDE